MDGRIVSADVLYCSICLGYPLKMSSLGTERCIESVRDALVHRRIPCPTRHRRSQLTTFIGSKQKKNRRSSVSSDERDDLDASMASLDPNSGDRSGVGRGASKSPLVRARALASKLRDSIISTSSAGPETVWTARNNYAWDMQLLYKRKITNLYVLATSLRAYVELNYSGFRKILKK